MQVFLPKDGRPIKAWVDGVEFEDTARAQVENVAALPFIFKHVAIMPDVHWGMGATIGSVIATKGAIIPAAVGVDIGCFCTETRIPLLDGTQVAIGELVGKTVWVYSCTADGQIVPGLATGVKTREHSSLVKVAVSGGDEIICTPDQGFMLLDGSYCEAKDLRFNQSLMPLYRRWESRDGYESCGTGIGKWHQTHELVYNHIHGPVGDGCVIHHDNVNHFDNRPDNLMRMTNTAHSTLHRLLGRSFDNADPGFQLLRRLGVARRAANADQRALMAKVGTANITRYMTDRPE